MSQKQTNCAICDNHFNGYSGLQTHLRRKHNLTYGKYVSQFISNEQTLKCKMCGLESNNLNSHIINTHQISIEEYKKIFNSQTCQLTENQIQQISDTKSKKHSKNKEKKSQQKKILEEMFELGVKPLKCQCCNFESMFSLITHIIRKHNLSVNEYKQKFPESVVYRNTPNHSKNISLALKHKLSSNIEARERFLAWRSFPSELKHWIRKGFDPNEAAQKVIDFQRKMSLKGNNEITCAKRSKKNSGSNNPMSLQSISVREGVSIEEAKTLTPCYGRKGKLHPFFGKKHTEQSLYKIANAHHLITPDYRSKPEIELAQFCSQIGDIKCNVRVGRWNVDILFEDRKLIVEFFGDFWHLNPKFYASSDRHGFHNKFITAQDIWNRDQYKIDSLQKLGYNVIVIWENDWHLNKQICQNKITDLD